MSSSRGCREEASIAVEPPANVLCRAPSFSQGATEICPGLAGGDRNLLLVSLSGNPERRLEAWKRQGDLPRNVAVLSVEQSRGAAAAGGSTGVTRGPGGSTISTATVSEPGDLTGIGIKVNQCLSAWEDDDVGTDVCFDSVTTLLQYVDTRRVFRFLHVLTRRVQSVGALAHYHVDPGAHDEQTLATIEGVFSDVFEYDEATESWTEF
ncbi:hypothetical protein HWV07_19435 [Natronomonas salina]|uniref:DUF7504 family protein n=1 Tax=Natronomonas salina TaxID=1710540 RepID=UPI0015B43AAF|nr:hypothetical protein [Natronomonas salina]QLD91099.1 hypothetical protein HWV07_19435 [Natronomonas salina]